jgi:gluconokinase
MVVVVMGVAGVGKTTIGSRLAAELGWQFHDADAYHPPANVAKMRRGQPLDDRDRAPWIDRLSRAVAGWVASGTNVVLACSALRAPHRARLRVDRERVRFVHLSGPAGLVAQRLAKRTGHFMPAELLVSQLRALDPPTDALAVSIVPPPDEVVAAVRRGLGI